MSPPRDAVDRERVACLLVPDLPLRAELRAHPDLADLPFVVATGSEGRAQVLEASRAAYLAGVRARGSVTHARAVCSELRIRVISPALERAARQALLDVALSFSPRAEPAPRSAWAFSSEAAVFLDASGIHRLYDSERLFASAVAARAARLGLPAVVSVASSRSISQLVARQCVITQSANIRRQSASSGRQSASSRERGAGGPGVEEGEEGERERICVLPRGAEERFLAPLPIDLLDPDDGLGQRLTRFGVHTVRDLLRLPRRALAERLGPDVLRLAALALGEAIEAPLPAPVDHRLEEAIDLEFPVDQQEPLRFVLRGLLSRLMERLELRHLACGPLDLQLDLEGGGRDSRRVGIAAPTRDVRVLLRLLSLALETKPPEAPVTAVSLSTEGQPARRDQLDLFRPRGPDPNTLDRTLSELESLCGAGRVGAPQIADDHRPDAFRMKPFQPASEANRGRGQAARTSLRADHTESLSVRALRPPVTAEVHVNRGLPTSIRSAVASGHVLHASGPWRTTGRWWSDADRYALDYYDIQVDDGVVLRLCFDWLDRSWRIDGIYD